MDAVLTFWFGPKDSSTYGEMRKEWFTVSEEFDESIRSAFLPLVESIEAKLQSAGLDGVQIPPTRTLSFYYHLRPISTQHFSEKSAIICAGQCRLESCSCNACEWCTLFPAWAGADVCVSALHALGKVGRPGAISHCHQELRIRRRPL